LLECSIKKTQIATMLNKIVDFFQEHSVAKFFLSGIIIALIHSLTHHNSVFLYSALGLSFLPVLTQLPFFENKLTYDQKDQIISSFLLISSVVWGLFMWTDLQDYPQAYTLTAITNIVAGLIFFRSIKKRLMIIVPMVAVLCGLILFTFAKPAIELIVGLVGLTVLFLFFKPAEKKEKIVTKDAIITDKGDNGKYEMIAEIDKLKTKNRDLLEELRQTKVDLSAAEMAKMEFLATMSHEIRTPLNGIIPILDILLDSEVTDFQRDYLSTAHVSAIQMQKLIDDLLDFSKVEAGNLTIETKGLKIQRVMEAVKSSYKQAADKKGIKIEIEMGRGVSPLLRGDPTRLRQVLSNLLSNAVKFSHTGTIKLRTSKLKDSPTKEIIRFEVIDQGVGLDTETADNIFKPFTQEDGSSTRKFGGTGLGLAISKRIVELMNGTIGVESGKGKGSNFYFDLPLLKSVGETGVGDNDKPTYQAILVNTNPLLFNKLSQNLKSENVPFQKALGLSQAYEIFASIKKLSSSTENILLFIDFETAGKQVRTLCNDLVEDKNMQGMYACIITESGRIAGVPQLPNIKLVSKTDSISELLNKIEVLQASRDARAEAEKLSEGIITEPESQSEDLSGETEQATDAPVKASAPVSMTGMSEKVLLVEDNEINLKVAEKLIQYIGYDYDFAMNGQEALEKVKDTRYRMILMDCLMPVMDGYRCTENIRKMEEQEGLTRTPILAMTANAMLGDREKCLDAGMDDYMSKPLNRYILEKTLKKWDPFDQSAAKAAEVLQSVSSKSDDTSVKTEEKQDKTVEEVGSKPERLPINQKWLNTKSLTNIKEFMGDEVVQLLEMFEKETPDLIKKMRIALKGERFEEIQKMAHMLKSTSANIGANGLSFFARKMELAAEVSNGSQLEEIYTKIRKAYALTSPEIAKYIKNQMI